MAGAIALRKDFDGKMLRGMAKGAKDASQARRLLALASIYDGGSRTEAAKIGDVTLQTVRDWVTRFNENGPAGLVDGKAPGAKPILNDDQRRALKEMVEAGPIPSVHGVVRWRLCDLAQWLNEEYGLSVSEQTMSREMRALGFRKISARKRHYAQDERALDAFKKTSAPRWRKSGRSSIPA